MQRHEEGSVRALLGGHYKKAGDEGLLRDDVSVSYPLHLADY